MSLIKTTITDRGTGINVLPLVGGPALYGFDVNDIVSPIRFSGGKSFFTARTNKDGANNNLNGSKVQYKSSDSLASISAQSTQLLLLTVTSRRGTSIPNESYVFVSNRVTENFMPIVGGTRFFYTEDGDPLPVEYTVSQTVSQIVAQTTPASPTIAVQNFGVTMPPEPKINFVGFEVDDNPSNTSTDIVMPYVNVKNYGAVGDGVANDRPAFLAAVATGKNVFVPSGTYLLTGAGGGGNLQMQLQDDQSIFGIGDSSKIKFQANSRAIGVGQNSIISNLYFIGSGKSSGNNFEAGIQCFNKIDWSIKDCIFTDVAGASGTNAGAGIFVITLMGAGADWQNGGKISRCKFENNGCGLNFNNRGEYVTTSQCSFSFNSTAVSIGAGNTTIIGCDITNNVVGLDIFAGQNTGHGIVSGCHINHNSSYNVRISDNTFGHTFNGCHVYEGPIYIKNSAGIVFNGCEIDVTGYFFENSIATRFISCLFDVAYGNTVNDDYNSTQSETRWVNCTYIDGTPFDSLTVSVATPMSLNTQKSTYVYDNVGTAVWTAPRVNASQDKVTRIVNINPTGTITFNTKSGGNDFFDMNAGAYVSTYSIGPLAIITVVDNGSKQILLN